MVKKAMGKWQISINYTDLNKACSKDSYSLLMIDWLIDVTSSFGMLSFIDAFSRYNQIRMVKEDQEKMAFIMDHGLYCYKVMPFGLKNADATYQRLMNKVFTDQLRRNMEAYIEDMLVKSKSMSHHVADLRETFSILRRQGMRLNLAKCVFGVTSKKFLGFIISERRIEVNPDKIRVVLDLPSPCTVKEI